MKAEKWNEGGQNPKAESPKTERSPKSEFLIRPGESQSRRILTADGAQIHGWPLALNVESKFKAILNPI